MDFLKNFAIPELDDEDVTVGGFSIKGIINAIIAFINKIIKAEF